ncbi:hypothetical protein [Aquimarina sp. RZ0]|uniref:hypothetical protein n=1 Tax=Aquimarina sp. RZ0 TaxID=2607730 RepID=UPI0011F2E141|nr:hypothetical protein [Aquimarina sp. RZ0]KAA1247933.1 hypothetical protein F0000_01555 [Aquimarina sp. RZ0]
MKERIFFGLLLLVTVSSFSQINYEKGYFIESSGDTLECYIKNRGWLNNPTEFEYKLAENTDSKIKTIKTVKEFGVGDLMYKKFLVKIDTSKERIEDLDEDRNPKFIEKTLFLKVLVEGDANLYHYTGNSFSDRFFYDFMGSEIEQLVHNTIYN